ncbi:histidine phosphatase family protein [Anaerosacchariphilus polymeriproducens]|uniref:Histidine phosphatase family protein n=1 Tax=Anaerosacchariphilus polymeriproducens TaxID=1812858 RepID=A0A371ATZ3_9FIRM|nr:histidine phosphatase family protein [Anaerosacchariphilus polymeriproducens]RDU22970.1 histidine phosphatase family protein [Anaerosacchariphilus polymeriproducens]
MKITLIRHGETKGNFEKRYIGATDEPLSSKGIGEIKQNLEKHVYPKADIVIVSPKQRCIQTAKIVYSTKNLRICDQLQECNFGRFENKNYIELSGDKDYQNWIQSNGTIDFPDGESIVEFKSRCIRGFEECINLYDRLDIVFVIHGGTIMSVLEKFGFPHREYFDWQIKNGNGYTGEWKDGKLHNLTKLF